MKSEAESQYEVFASAEFLALAEILVRFLMQSSIARRLVVPTASFLDEASHRAAIVDSGISYISECILWASTFPSFRG